MYLLIGYGNPLRTDDGVGQVVVERLSTIPETAGCRDSLTTIAAHQLLPEHAEAIGRAERVVFVDAEAGEEPGRITVHEIKPDVEGSAGLIHEFTPQTLLAYAQLLYGSAPPAATLITVNGFSFDYGEGLSDEMSRLLPRLIGRVSDLFT